VNMDLNHINGPLDTWQTYHLFETLHHMLHVVFFRPSNLVLEIFIYIHKYNLMQDKIFL
jgi:hypothetical protein